MELKDVCVTNLPVKCQKLIYNGLKAEFTVVLIMISFIMVRHISFAFSVAHQLLFIPV